MSTKYARYLGLTLEEIARSGFAAAFSAFYGEVANGRTDDENLAVKLAIIEGDDYADYGTHGVGNWRQYIVNLSPTDGKLATVLEFGTDSGVAFAADPNHPFFGTEDNPKRWTGAVRRPYGYVRASGETRSITFAFAGSGDLSPIDQYAVEVACAKMGLDWQLWQRALEEADLASHVETGLPDGVISRGPQPPFSTLADRPALFGTLPSSNIGRRHPRWGVCNQALLGNTKSASPRIIKKNSQTAKVWLFFLVAGKGLEPPTSWL